MPGTHLAQAVEHLAGVASHLRDTHLSQDWAWGAYDSEGIRFAFFRTYEELRDLAAKTAIARAAHGPAVSSSQRILMQYHSAYRDLQAVLLGLGAEEADRAPAEGEWSTRQVVGHIVGAEVGFYVVIKYALERNRSGDQRPPEISDAAWDAILGENATSVEDTLDGPMTGLKAYHGALHERILREFASISEGELAIPSMYWEGYSLGLRFRLHRFDSHLRQHTVQIDKTLVQIGCSPTEVKRLLRLIYAALAEAEGPTIGAPAAGAALREQTAAAIAARTEEIAQLAAGA